MSIQAMKQALEALGYGYDAARCTAAFETIQKAEQALRAAITEAGKCAPVGSVGCLVDECVMPTLEHMGLTRDTMLYTHPQPAIPDGWQLVPVEPTREMLCAWQDTKGSEEYFSSGEGIRLCYKAMLAAAPKPENGHD